MERFGGPELISGLVVRIHELARAIGQRLTIMEVCGTHTMCVAQSGLRGLLPPNVRLVSGPGCPVCVTPVEFLDVALTIARQDGVTLATFGDLIRVPASQGSLETSQALGCDVRVVYSPRDVIALARLLKERTVVFLAVGFETTAPAVAATLMEVRREGLKNVWVLCGHKLIPPAIETLLDKGGARIQGLILPGHVSAIIGPEPYEFIPRRYGIPGVITGFTPLDVLMAIKEIFIQIIEGRPRIANLYTRAVRNGGNPKAKALIEEVFETSTSKWRGLGEIPASGLTLRSQWAWMDASNWEVPIPRHTEPKGCMCGDVLKGLIDPPECPLFGSRCTPEAPVGPCMVSSEGPCAAWFRYRGRRTGE